MKYCSKIKARCPLKEAAPHVQGPSSDRALTFPFSNPNNFDRASLCPISLAPCLCPFINKQFISGSQTGLVASPGDQGYSSLLSFFCLWSLTHSATLKSHDLRQCSVSIKQYSNSHSHFHQLPQKLVALFEDQGNCSRVLEAISGQNSAEGQDGN